VFHYHHKPYTIFFITTYTVTNNKLIERFWLGVWICEASVKTNTFIDIIWLKTKFLLLIEKEEKHPKMPNKLWEKISFNFFLLPSFWGHTIATYMSLLSSTLFSKTFNNVWFPYIEYYPIEVHESSHKHIHNKDRKLSFDVCCPLWWLN